MNKPLTESRVTKIATTIPDIKDRADMFVHLSVMDAWGGSQAGLPSDKELERVINYIRQTNQKDTVRAKYARKIAQQLEERKHRK